MRHHLPILTPGALVLSACPESFDDMTPVARGRHCSSCDRTVVDMTRMSRAEAEGLFVREQENVCGYVLSNEAGDTFFAEPTLARPPWSRGVLATGLAAALLVTGCSSNACEDAPMVWLDSPEGPAGTGPTVTSVQPLGDKPANVTSSGVIPVGAVPPIPVPRAGGLRRR